MKLLLDTCTFLWIINGEEELSVDSKTLFADPDNQVYLSPISYWEILVKHKLGKLPLPEKPQHFITKQRKLHRIESLVVDEEAITQLERLPDYHKDPFDRMLICQAITHGFTILTPDQHIAKYPVPVIW